MWDRGGSVPVLRLCLSGQEKGVSGLPLGDGQTPPPAHKVEATQDGLRRILEAVGRDPSQSLLQ